MKLELPKAVVADLLEEQRNILRYRGEQLIQSPLGFLADEGIETEGKESHAVLVILEEKIYNLRMRMGDIVSTLNDLSRHADETISVEIDI